MPVDFVKLTQDIREAKAEAELINVPDGGSCNSDRCVLAVPKGTRAASVKNAAFAAGIRCYVTDSRMRGRLFHLDIGGGMGAQRTDGSLVTLTEFLAHCDGHYVTKKLRLDTRSKELDDVVDDDETFAAVATRIVERRRSKGISRERARELWEDAESWRSGEFNMHDVPPELAGFLDCFWEYVHHKPSCRFEFMWKELWPFFSAWLRENVLAAQPQEAQHA